MHRRRRRRRPHRWARHDVARASRSGSDSTLFLHICVLIQRLFFKKYWCKFLSSLATARSALPDEAGAKRCCGAHNYYYYYLFWCFVLLARFEPNGSLSLLSRRRNFVVLRNCNASAGAVRFRCWFIEFRAWTMNARSFDAQRWRKLCRAVFTCACRRWLRRSTTPRSNCRESRRVADNKIHKINNTNTANHEFFVKLGRRRQRCEFSECHCLQQFTGCQ